MVIMKYYRIVTVVLENVLGFPKDIIKEFSLLLNLVFSIVGVK